MDIRLTQSVLRRDPVCSDRSDANLFSAQSDHRIDSCRTCSRDVACKYRDQSQHHTHRGIGDRIACSNFE